MKAKQTKKEKAEIKEKLVLIKKTLKDNGQTLTWLANKVEMHRIYLYGVLSGRNKLTLGTWLKIKEILKFN